MERPRKGLPLHTRIFLGLVIGALLGGYAQWRFGADSPELKDFILTYTRPIGQIFLRLIFMVVVPLLFAALVLGVAEIGDVKKIGRVGLRSLAMTLVLSGLAVVIGLTAFNLVKPGSGISPEARANFVETFGKSEAVQKARDNAAKAETASDQIINLVSSNPVKDAAEGQLLPFMIFALIFGVALATIEAEKAAPVIAFLEGIFAVALKVIGWAMRLAPLAVAALVFGSVAVLGWASLQQVALFVVLVLGALAFHQFVVYSLAIKLIAKRDPVQFFRQIRTMMLTAFGTSSSNATLPVALRTAREDVGLPKDISSFVLTVGATANQNGTALFEGITVLFLANFAGVQLGVGEQVTVLIMAIIAGIGTAGVPGGSWPMIMVLMMRIGVDPAWAGLVMGVDRILDMSRTVLNVTGDMTIAACVTAMEGGEREAMLEAVAE